MNLNKIYNMPCEEGLLQIDDKSIDLILTDPPFLHEIGGIKRGIAKGCLSQNSMTANEMSDFGKVEIYNFLNLVKPKMKIFNSYIFCSKLQIPYYLNWALENNLKFDLHFWQKIQFMLNKQHFAHGTEYIIRIYDNGCGLNTDCPTSFYKKIKTYKQIKDKLHESEKPVALLFEYIKLSSKENDLILDPFAGSGSTAEACLLAKRNFICFEKLSKFSKIANERLNNYKQQTKMF